jgi:hypothetical protein
VQKNLKQGGISARVDLDLGGTTLTSISAWRFRDWTPHDDADSSALSIYTGGNQFDRQRQWSQEIRGARSYAPSKPQTDSYAAFGQATWHATDAIYQPTGALT